jgi:hypothetical protein
MAKITSEFAFEEHLEAVLLKTHGFLPAQQADYDKAQATCYQSLPVSPSPGKDIQSTSN